MKTSRPRRLRHPGRRGPAREHWALRDFNLRVLGGETVGLVGKNGSGKSTLLRVLAGVTQPTVGRMLIARRVSALLTLGEAFHPMLSGKENAVSGAIVAGLTRRQARARLGDITAFAELEEYMDEPLRTYSDGMRLRLGFATAINVDPEILLIDEMLAVGDLRFRQKCTERLEVLQSSGVTLVVASHDMYQIRALCNRVVWIADGQMRQLGSAEDVVEDYRRAMDAAAPVREDGPQGVRRRGSGEVEIASVHLLDSHGREIGMVLAGGPLTVAIDYVVHEAVPDAIFGVSAHDKQDGTRCFDLSTEADGVRVGKLNGSGTIHLHLERLDLAGGTYHLDVGVYEAGWDRPYDYLWQALLFEVDSSDFGGPLAPPHRWTMG